MSIFLSIPEDQKFFQSKNFFAIKDRFPVSPGHTLIISKKLKQDYFELNLEEKLELSEVIGQLKILLDQELNPDGYNIGMNCGETAGQTVFHFHCHMIPRYKGDMKDPKGGVRHCIEGKGYY